MNYSESLPKINYDTTLGSFTLVDFTSYYEMGDSSIPTQNLDVDKSQTLIEAGYSLYKDANSIWLFLLANKTINPFTLTKQSTSAEIADFETTTTIWGSLGSFDMYAPKGSLITPFTGTAGYPWQFSYVGNFSLTGGFAISKEYNSFSRRTYLKELQGITLISGSDIQIITKGMTNYYETDLSASPFGIILTEVKTQDSITKESSYKQNLIDTTYLLLDSELPILAKGSSPYEPTGVTSAEISYVDSAELSSITIKAFNAYSVGYKSFSLIEQNYEF